MQAYEIVAPGRLALVERAEREPAPHEVVVEVRSIALNRRDLTLIESARSGPHSAIGLIPCSDAAGRIAACGGAVTEFAVGDAVVSRFLPDWIDGRPPTRDLWPAFGGPHPGVLAERVTAASASFAPAPEGMRPNAVATLPCAALTAWRAVGGGHSLAGQWVGILGSGGVSVFALQLATALGARVAVITRDLAKSDRLRELGAAAVFAADGSWDEQLLQLTDNRGVDLSIDMGTRGTLSRLTSVAAPGGVVAVVGVLDGMHAELDLGPCIRRGISLRGVNAGSRSDFDAMTRFMQARRIEPVIDTVVAFESASEAFEALRAARGIGKIVIRRGGTFAAPAE